MKKILSLLALFCLFLPLNLSAKQEDANKLQQEIEDKTDLVNSLVEKIRAYEENIRTKNEEKADLQNKVSILEDNISKTEVEISKT